MPSGVRISLILAMAENRVIGRGGTIPWKVPGEQKLFRRITMGHTLIMGRKTHEDIGRPLVGRLNIVISRQPGFQPAGCLKADSLENALALCPVGENEVFIIGGGELFRQSMPLADRVYLTVIALTVEGDTFFPEMPEGFTIVSRERGAGPPPYVLYVYERERGGSAEKESEACLRRRAIT
jgi:dihydrofolate reductase